MKSLQKELTVLFAATAVVVLASCTVPPSATPSRTGDTLGPRTIVLDGREYSEEDYGEFTAWYCRDFDRGGRTLVEVGFVDGPFSDEMGFVLYDGGDTGETALYRRRGLERRWDWGPRLEYAFVITPDNTGLYFDFSSVPEGETTTPREVYKCRRR